MSIKRAVLFDDETLDQKYLKELARAQGCELLVIDHARVSDFSQAVIAFDPEVAIVDIEFPQSQVAGRHILRFLKTNFKVPIIVWSKQVDLPESARRLFEHCEAIGGVQALVGKQERLSWENIMAASRHEGP